MAHVVILGGGTAGTMVANKLRRKLGDGARITVVDRDDAHLYQPGLLLLPFGVYDPHDLLRPRDRFLHRGVDLVLAEVAQVLPKEKEVLLGDGRTLRYDVLVVATGVAPRPDQTPGMSDGQWRRSVFDFYSLEGAVALRDALADWPGGRLVVHVTEMPVKCPVAPLEFAFLADAFFEERRMRERVEIVYVTPLEGPFTKPVASAHLGAMFADRHIGLEPDFYVERVDPETRTLVSMDEREVPFDLLVTVPVNMGADYVARSGLGDELNYVPVDRGTLQSTASPDVFAIGDANDIPASKAGSVAHFESDGVVENIVDHLHGRPLTHRFDGHANCFIETGHGKGLLIDFNYDTEPLPGVYPYPRVGPLSLLKETRANHLGKLAFLHLYWNVLLPGRPMPVPSRMSMAGKETAGTKE
ncbi:type III sulfide quinone reductase, selenoprotein subtype [Georgenia thermotolerans]|uniref:NAD(P)/FAD-dependent oxidoreductase n=1 Tax=Georgenia thermotolerans TaxID=527326 RepID=A0A7J5UR83_9MICO|nr:FAD/NAD(P)-binding oxidoreductase [Georgenia thermotolerans]KAE8764962.1 NAD(P)/FAD-dependent oxidoreductase [Georgenia thermotolerans]